MRPGKDVCFPFDNLVVRVCVQGIMLTIGDAVSPLSLLKNPMILIAVVGLGFVFGMPYLMDSSKLSLLSFPCANGDETLS